MAKKQNTKTMSTEQLRHKIDTILIRQNTPKFKPLVKQNLKPTKPKLTNR